MDHGNPRRNFFLFFFVCLLLDSLSLEVSNEFHVTSQNPEANGTTITSQTKF
ncbi:unnamed protein product, partial [Vitis vinifera]|uniref:Uncharacterized protein n=1 Tax=Vitis vinifera TaxID=29760 RepID=D7TG15_VITVI